MRSKFTKNAMEVLEFAETYANETGSSYVGSEHLLMGLVRANGVAATALSANHVSKDKIEQMMEQANALYKEGKTTEAQALYDQISALNKQIQEEANKTLSV